MSTSSDHSLQAKRYLDNAQEQIALAEKAINDTARKHHVTMAEEYLLLAEKELMAAERATS